MGSINVGRVILGGLVAGVISDILGFLVDGVMLAPRWQFAMQQLGKTEFSGNQWVIFSALGLVGGIATIWVYAAIRPRYGAGPKTAVYAAITAWVIGAVLPNAALWAAGLLPRGVTVLTTAGSVVELVVGALAGAALYREATVTARSGAVAA